MRVLLIYPPVTIYGPGKVNPHPPLGLAYLAGYLEKNKHQVEILDALALGRDNVKTGGKMTRVGLSNSQIKKAITSFKPDLIGVSVMFTAFANDAHEVAKIVKEVSRKIIIVFGGAHVSIDPKAVVKDENVDFAIKGEGEISFLNLVRALEGSKGYEQIAGLSFRKGKRIISNLPGPLIKNLDELPFPARHLLPMKLYSLKKDSFSMRFPTTTMITSRGCPGKCVYCSIHSVWGYSWRGRSAKNVVDEIKHLVDEYGIKEIYFQDDSMSVSKKRMNEICDEIIRSGIDIRWTTPNGIAHWSLDKKLLDKMKKAGCYRITFGIESGNPEIRRWVGKPYSLRQAKELTQYANRIGMWTIATNIIGFPYETKQQIEDTVDFAIDSDVDFALFFRLGPRPGTLVYEIFKKEKWLPNNERELYSESVACETKYIKGKELYDIQNKAYSKFMKRRIVSFFNPLRIIRKIHSFEDFAYVVGLLIAGTKMALSLVSAKTGVTSRSIKR